MPAATAPIVTGAEYDRHITALESDRRTRSAFQHLVVTIAPPGGALLDFGAGTGIDARFYAERGFTVAAYDVDTRMCEFFATRCRDLLDAGRVSLESGSYREFLTRDPREGARAIDLVTSNFAPLNLIGDLRELFAKFHALTEARGRVLASVLSPYFLGDLKYGWWWRNAPRLWSAGHYSVQGAQASIVRRRVIDFERQCAPYFALRHVFPGMPSGAARVSQPVPAGGDARRAQLRLGTCRYMFLLFDRLPHADRDERQ